MLIERLKAEGRVDVFQTVKTLKAQRLRVLENLVTLYSIHVCTFGKMITGHDDI